MIPIFKLHILCVRHGQSTLNKSGDKLRNSRRYKKFSELYEKNPNDPLVAKKASQILKSARILHQDHESSLTDLGRRQALQTGARLRLISALPDVVHVSPYRRTQETLEGMKLGWPFLQNVPVHVEEDIREQSFGDAIYYNDFKIFFALNPEERARWEHLGRYHYRFPNGESLPDVRKRTLRWYINLQKNLAGKRVLAVSHFSTIVTIRANLSGWTPEPFMAYHETIPKINCAVSQFEIIDKSAKARIIRFNESLL